MKRPALSRLTVAYDLDQGRSVLTWRSADNRLWPVVALGQPLHPKCDPFPRISTVPLHELFF